MASESTRIEEPSNKLNTDLHREARESKSLVDKIDRFLDPKYSPGPYPREAARIMRYMDLCKLEDMLKKRELFFARIDCMGDESEMLIPDVEHPAISPDDDESDRLVKEIGYGVSVERKANEKAARAWLIVSCWNIEDHESWPMWTAYCTDPSQGVCVQSTFGALQKALIVSPRGPSDGLPVVKIKEVRYGKPPVDFLESVFCKRIEYEDERELRAVTRFLDHPRCKPPGDGRGVDLALLIRRVLVGPKAERAFRESVDHQLMRAGLGIRAEHSAFDQPAYQQFNRPPRHA